MPVFRGSGQRRWFLDVRVWWLVAAFAVIIVLDLLFPAGGLLTLVIVPVIASIALGRPDWTAGLGIASIAIFLASNIIRPEEMVLFWRRLGVIVVVGVLSAVTARVVARANRRVQSDADQIQATLDSLLDPFVLFTPVRDENGRAVDLVFAQANDAAFAYNNSTPEEMLGHTFLEFFPALGEKGPMAQYLACVETGQPVILDDYEYPNEILDDIRRYDIRAVRTQAGMVLSWRDVTERHRSMQALADSERRYRLLAENSSDVIWQVAPSGVIEWASDSTLPVLGWTREQLIGQPALDFIHPDERMDAADARRRVLQGVQVRDEFRVGRADGRHQWMAFSVRGVPGPDGVSRIVSLRDIDAEVSARQELARAVGRDALTGLGMREAVQRQISDLNSAVGPENVAVLCIGIDSLSTVNDAYTHAAGDVVIVTTAARIVGEIGNADRVARGAGVDFLVVLSTGIDGQDPAVVAEAIRHAAREPIVLGEHRILPTVSVGIATGDLAPDPEHLIRAATLAMRTAKELGRDRVSYANPARAVAAERRLTLLSEVTEGLSHGEFTAWLQPIADLANGHVHGYEALARWIRPTGEIVGPGGFMPTIESTPIISRLDATALEASIAALEALPASTFVSVNVSARALTLDPYVDMLLARLSASGADPRRLHAEVTETALFEVSEEVVSRMQRIADAGVSWYVDDFGTGYSSISHLRDLPVSGLKLDLSFTRGIAGGDSRSLRLAQALAGMAQGLGLDTIAEGVEGPEEARVLMAQGWRLGQGWLYGRAVPLADVV